MNIIKTVNAAEHVYGEDSERTLAQDPAEAYHEASKLSKRLAFRQTDATLLAENSNALMSTTRSIKRWSQVASIALPAAEFSNAALGDILLRRRSKGSFASKPISLVQLATVAFAGCGVTKRVPLDSLNEQVLRTAPSGGALYPIDLYIAVHRVDGVVPGLYYYNPLDHALSVVRAASMCDALADACVYPAAIETSAVTLLLSAMFWRSRFKYRMRAYRFTVLEAGHIVQNILLAANSLGLDALPIGGFYDGLVDELLNLDGVNEGVLYAAGIGAP